MSYKEVIPHWQRRRQPASVVCGAAEVTSSGAWGMIKTGVRLEQSPLPNQNLFVQNLTTDTLFHDFQNYGSIWELP